MPPLKTDQGALLCVIMAWTIRVWTGETRRDGSSRADQGAGASCLWSQVGRSKPFSGRMTLSLSRYPADEMMHILRLCLPHGRHRSSGERSPHPRWQGWAVMLRTTGRVAPLPDRHEIAGRGANEPARPGP